MHRIKVNATKFVKKKYIEAKSQVTYKKEDVI